MSRRARIHRDPDTGRWVVQLPQFGFTPSQPYEFPTWRAAMRFIDDKAAGTAGVTAVQERVNRRKTVFAEGNNGRGWWA